MATPTRQFLLAALTAAGACGNVVDLPSTADRAPFVEVALIAGRSASIARVGWIDHHLPGAILPAPASTVDLILYNETTGRSARLTQQNDTLFVVTLAIEAGHRYRLAGRIGDATIHATTIVPDRFEVELPTGDSIPLAAGLEDFLSATVDYRWHAIGATAFAVDSAWFPPGQAATRAPIGQLIIPRRPPGSPARTLRIVAVNRDLDEYLYRTPAPSSNVVGGFGVVGAAIVAERVLVTR